MKLPLLFFLVASCPFIIYGKKPKNFVKEVAILNKYAANGTKIANDAILLTERGFLGDGELGFVYEGILVDHGLQVAVKFVPKQNAIGAEKELSVLNSLNVYGNPERYGIPCIYFQDKWKTFILYATTKLEESLEDINKRVYIRAMDSMILMRDFVIQSKFIHSLGINHNDMHAGNIMIRSHRSFLIDFNKSVRMAHGRRINDNVSKPALFDWIGFIEIILGLYDIEHITNNWNRYKHEIEEHISDPAFIRVLYEFGNEAFSDDDTKLFPDYDHLYDFINNEINEKHAEDHDGFAPMFSWLEGQDKLYANLDISANPLPNIRSEIAHPSLTSSSL